LREIGLYLHIPFCIKKCLYCDFISFQCNEKKIEEYLKALIKEIELYREEMTDSIVNTIFIGGGTPSILNEAQISTLMDSILKNFNIKKDLEITIESNPGTLTKGKLQSYKNNNINRLSIGLQSDNNVLLNIIGRIHTFEEFLSQYILARNMGFNINIDLMYNLPNQSLKSWEQTLKNIVKLKPNHISVYSLKLEENTPLYKLYLEDSLNLSVDEIERKMHHYAIDYLLQNDYIHYEISNFSKEGYQCLHNINYWHNREYLGIGVSAYSYINSVRYSNTTDIKKYIKALKDSTFPIETKEYKTREDEIFETIFLGLRLTKGLNIKEFIKRYNINPLEKYKKEIEKLNRLELIEIFDSHIRLTRYGIDVSNQVFLEFLK